MNTQSTTTPFPYTHNRLEIIISYNIYTIAKRKFEALSCLSPWLLASLLAIATYVLFLALCAHVQAS